MLETPVPLLHPATDARSDAPPAATLAGKPLPRARTTARIILLLAAALFTMLALSGCSDDKIVFRDRAPFNPPPDAALGFLGYYDAEAKQTTCGNCHVSFQGSWAATGHSDAWNTLQASGHAGDSCIGCHTTNGRGNLASGTPAGHDAVADEVYYDVQCESCHGPGLEHVEGVGQGQLVRPLARLGMSGEGNCGDCHSGSHHGFTDEWEQSNHAIVDAGRVSRASCAGCHEGRGALARWGVEANYAEKDTADAYQPITCAVCHDPHGSGNPAQLRFPVTSTDEEQNLCIKCHLNRAEPNTSSHGAEPHAPQGGVLLGFAGWRPPGFAYDTSRIYGSHATTKNPKLCAGCHIAKFTVTDELTGDFVFNATGHLMRPIPCLDQDGKPTADNSCAYTTTARTWQTCTAAGCHASDTVAAAAFNTVRARMKFYTDQLWLDSNGDDEIQASPTDGGILAMLKATQPNEWSGTDNQITPAEGAEFNARLCGEYGQSNTDNSKGTHNPFLCESLLIASIQYLNTHYSLTTPSPRMPDWMSGPVGGTFSSSLHVARTPLDR